VPDVPHAALENGEYDKEKWLKGAVLDFQPINETKGCIKHRPT